jgi:hypothetical protein
VFFAADDCVVFVTTAGVVVACFVATVVAACVDTVFATASAAVVVSGDKLLQNITLSMGKQFSVS